MDTIIGIILIAAAVFLVIAVLVQSGKDKSLSSAIGGASSSDTYYGKNKGSTKDQMLNKITTVVAVIFAALVLVSFILQDDKQMKYEYEDFKNGLTATETTKPAETSGSESTSTTEESSSTTTAGSEA